MELIDRQKAKKLLDDGWYRGVYPRNDIMTLPTIEAIPKADYEARLKADMVAMLTELQLEIAENIESIVGHYGKDIPMANRPSYKIERNGVRQDCIDIIEQKINSLKAEIEPQAETEET